MLENLIVEGIDRLGKSTLIAGFKDKMGYFQVLHYQKPELLSCYEPKLTEYMSSEAAKKWSLRKYQEESFSHLLTALSTTGYYICDRSHLGEAVYAKRYRGYDGNYVFHLEELAIKKNERFHENTLLVLLTTSDFSFITDDGLSLDVTKREEEQEDFKQAFSSSKIKNKMMIDVSDGRGGFKPPHAILDLVISSFTF